MSTDEPDTPPCHSSAPPLKPIVMQHLECFFFFFFFFFFWYQSIQNRWKVKNYVSVSDLLYEVPSFYFISFNFFGTSPLGKKNTHKKKKQNKNDMTNQVDPFSGLQNCFCRFPTLWNYATVGSAKVAIAI